jgi:hypothetical protein
MAHVSALAQHIFTLEPDKDAARLSLYQYLKNCCDATELVNAPLINRFYLRALGFTHWQQNKTALFNETESILHHFQDSAGAVLPLSGLMRASDLQVIAVENLRNLEVIVQKHLEKTLTPYDRVRVLREGPDSNSGSGTGSSASSRVVAITLHGDRSLKITTYPRALLLVEGELAPLHNEHSLFYSNDLSLSPMMIQQIEVGTHASARFHTGVEGLRGSFVRGYTFQKFGSIDGGGLNRYPLLFYPLKRLEQFFVDRKTDPMYLELTSTLEKALELLGAGVTPDTYRFAHAALERGRLALEHIFPDDKFARLLINNLEKSLALVQASQPSYRSVPTAASAFAPAVATLMGSELDAEPEGIDLLKDDSWPEIRNLPV